VLAALALAAAAAVAFLEGTAGGVSYAGEGWMHECAKWDAEGGRFLASTFFGAGVAELRAGDAEERLVLADPDAAGRVALGLAIDAPRRRLLLVYADRIPRFGYAALGAYELGSWRRLFFTRLDVPGLVFFSGVARLPCLFADRIGSGGNRRDVADRWVSVCAAARRRRSVGSKIWSGMFHGRH